MVSSAGKKVIALDPLLSRGFGYPPKLSKAIQGLAATGLLLAGLSFTVEKISWTPPNSILLNSELFRWEQGEDKNNSYDLTPSNTFIITAAPQTDLKLTPKEPKKQSPMMVLSTQGDFEASVKVSFQSITNYQRAILGVRNTDNKYQQVFLLLAENNMLEIGVFNSGQRVLEFPRIPYSSEFIYLKIKRRLGNVALSYSKNGREWSPFTSKFPYILYSKVEIFLEYSLLTEKT